MDASMRNHLTISALAITVVVGAAGSELRAAGAESGTTSVSMFVDGARLAIELTTDPETLLARLDRLAGRGRAAETPNGGWADGIVRRQTELLRHLVVQFDDRVAQVHVETLTPSTMDAADASSPRITIGLAATVPDDARSVRWTYALASAAYPLTIRQGSSVTSETIAGAESSSAVALITQRRSAIERHFSAWVVAVLFAALVTFRVRERRAGQSSRLLTTTPGAPA
jgi:hypothetical protein